MKRVFFDWSRPFLPQVAEYVVSSSLDQTKTTNVPPSLNLGKYVFLLSGSRAQRTLEAYLQRLVEEKIQANEIASDWTPPSYLTLGKAPELLYSRQKRVADSLTRLYCESRAFDALARQAPDELRALIGDLPSSSNFSGRLQLAQTFLALRDELASSRQTNARIAASCRAKGLEEEVRRWETIDKLDKFYFEELRRIDAVDVNAAREEALRRGQVGGTSFDFFNGVPREYRLVGAVDLDRQQKAFFDALGDRVQYWIFAPESEKERFDEFGCVAPDAWKDYRLPISDDRLIQVDSPVEQGETAALLLRELSKKYDVPTSDGSFTWRYDPIAPEAVTIGTPDQEVVPFASQALSALGYDAISGEGESARSNRVFRLLANVADYLETRSFASLEELARRPDVEDYIRRVWTRFSVKDESQEESSLDSQQGENIGDLTPEDREALEAEELETATTDEQEAKQDGGSWIADFDVYRERFQPTRVDGRWHTIRDKDNSKRNWTFYALRKAARAIENALQEFCDATRPVLFRENVSQSSQRSEIDALRSDVDLASLKTSANDFDRARQAAFSGEFAFAQDAFVDRFRWTTNQRRLTLRAWAPILSRFLNQIYADVDESRYDRATEEQIDAFFKLFNETLNSLDVLPTDEEFATTGSNAIRLVLNELSSKTIPPPPNSRAVEMQGLLDLPFDDAPYLILTGFNERFVPSTRSSDLFLPDETRREIGVDDSERSYARDAYIVATLAHSRRDLFVIFGKRSLAGDPLLPSRLAFATEPQKTPERVCRFFADQRSDALETLRARQRRAGVDVPFPVKRESASDEIQTDSPRGFCAPKLSLSGTAPRLFRVTEFADFLSSPYRYFLRHALGLRAVEPSDSSEMNAAAFGALAHDVLREFGLDEKIRDATDADVLAGWLSAKLDEIAKTSFNDYSSPFVRIQIEQIRWRLRAFARWQAGWRRAGRVVKFVEKSTSSGMIDFRVAPSDVVKIVGRIDRIDYSPKENRWYVFDYKTFDQAESGKENAESEKIVDEETNAKLYSQFPNNVVDQKHRVKEKRLDETSSVDAPAFGWQNLQLPLYRRIFWEILREYYPNRAFEEIEKTKVSLAYIVLPRSSEVQAFGAPWNEEELRQAEEKVCWIVQTIRRLWGTVDPNAYVDPNAKEAFGKILSTAPLPYDDEFSHLTLDYLSNG